MLSPLKEMAPRVATLTCACRVRIHGNGRAYERLMCTEHGMQDVSHIEPLRGDYEVRQVRVGRNARLSL